MLGSKNIKETDESTLGKDSSVSLMHHDPKDLGSLILIQIIPKERTQCQQQSVPITTVLSHIVNGWIQSLRAAGFFNHESVGASLLFGNLRYQTQRLSHSRYLGRQAMLQRERCVTTLITPALLTQASRVIGAKPFAVKCQFQSWLHRVAHATRNKKQKKS